jgi:hypothetical protein
MMVSARHSRFAATRGVVGIAALAVMLAAVGCKSRDGKGGMFSSGPSRNNDPLVVGPGRIPKQNLPVPGRDLAGARGRSDPLLGSPTGRTVDRRGGYGEDPERWKNGPYLPGPDGTPASLAARTRNDEEGLKIDGGGGVPLKPAAGDVPATGGGRDDGLLFEELARYGVKRGDYSISREGGQVVARVRVPIAGGGASRGYVGTGRTETAAIQQVLDQVKLDQK